MAKNFCIYCGAALTPGVECSCRTGETSAPAYDDSTPAYAMDVSAYTAEPVATAEESKPKKFCIYCGSPLTPGVECSCRTAAPAPAYAEDAPTYDETAAYAMEAPTYTPEPEVTVAESAPSKFCIYCGSPLTPGVECSCRAAAPAPVYAEPAPVYSEPAPVYSEPASAPAATSYPKFCTRCGRPLSPGEICNCSGGAMPVYEIPYSGAVGGGLKTTMRTESKPETKPISSSPFLNKPSELD